MSSAESRWCQRRWNELRSADFETMNAVDLAQAHEDLHRIDDWMLRRVRSTDLSVAAASVFAIAALVFLIVVVIWSLV